MSTTSKYETLSVIGQGPECTVYRGRNRDIDAPVAIKSLSEELNRNVNRRERYFTEATTSAKLRHDHIATVLDVDRVNGWIVYELLSGSLAPQIAKGPLPAGEVVRVLQHALLALQQIHQAGYLHGNIKPTNLLADASQRIKLADGRYFPRDQQGELPAHRGLHKYVAPEILDSSFGDVGPPTDIYSLGFLALELLIGPAFDSRFRGVVQEVTDPDVGWIRWHTSREEDKISTAQLVLGISPRLATLIDRMVEKERLQRYDSAAEMLEDLAALKDVSGSPSTTTHAAAEGPSNGTAAAPPEAASKPAPPRVAPEAAKFEVGPLPAWPDAPVVLRHVAGPRAGEFQGLTASHFTVGSGLTCDVSFAEDGYANLEELAAEIQRGSEGWSITLHTSQPVLKNQDSITKTSRLRSGDIIRLSPAGPDFQFLIQTQNQRTLRDILGTYTPKLLAASIAAGKTRRPAAVAAAPAAPLTAESANKPKASPPGRSVGNSETRNAAPSESAAPSAPAVPAGPAGSSAPQGAAVASAAGESVAMVDQNKKWLLIIGATLLLALLILFFPSSGSPDAAPADPSTPNAGSAQTTENAEE